MHFTLYKIHSDMEFDTHFTQTDIFSSFFLYATIFPSFPKFTLLNYFFKNRKAATSIFTTNSVYSEPKLTQGGKIVTRALSVRL